MGKPFKILRRKRFESAAPGFVSYLRMVNKPQGVIKDRTTETKLGGHFDDATMSQSQYSVDKLFEGLGAYDRTYQWQPNQELLSHSFNAVHARFASLDNTLIPLEWQ